MEGRKDPAHRGASRRRHRDGFTILEILIAIVILVLGISGIIALFPSAIQSGNQTVEDSYAAAITQSVIDAVSVGMRESHQHVTDANGRLWTYFIFDHDGVWDAMAPQPQDYTTTLTSNSQGMTVAQADWCILLPQGPDRNNLPQLEPTFNYPSVRDFDNLGGGPTWVDHREYNALPSIPSQTSGNSPYDDWGPTFMRANLKGETINYVRRVYHLGRYRAGQELPGFPKPNNAPGPIRDEFLGEVVGGGPTGPTVDPNTRARVDPYPQYSFALSMRRTKVDNMTAGSSQAVPDGLITKEDMYSSNLYEVRVMVFRNFDSNPQLHQALAANPKTPIPRTNVPIREFVTLMSR